MLRFGSVPTLVPTFLVAGALVFYSGTAADEYAVLGPIHAVVAPLVCHAVVAPVVVHALSRSE